MRSRELIGTSLSERARPVAAAAFALLISTVLALAASGAGPGASTATAQTRPEPEGTNRSDCRPTRGHTRPVVLVHGTGGDQASFARLAPDLDARGYCVYSLDYGNRALGPVEDSAVEVKGFIERVLALTGARKVAVVGHSQGGMLPRHIIKFLGGKKLIAELIGLAPPNHGTEQPLAPALGALGCEACADQTAGSRFIRRLNRGDETPGRISYTVIQTVHDAVVIPYQSAFLEPGKRTTNILLQDGCPASTAEHALLPDDPLVIRWVRNALRRKGRPANPDSTPRC